MKRKENGSETNETVYQNDARPVNPPPEKAKRKSPAATIAVVAASAVILTGTAGYIAVKNDVIRFPSSAEKEAASEADELSGKGEYSKAAEQYCAAISKDPTNPEYYQGAADAYLALGDTDMAEEMLADGIMATGSVVLEERLAEMRSGTVASENIVPQDKPNDAETAEADEQVTDVKYIMVDFSYETEKLECDTERYDISMEGPNIFTSFKTYKNYSLHSDGTLTRDTKNVFYSDGSSDPEPGNSSTYSYSAVDGGFDKFVLTSNYSENDFAGMGGGSYIEYNPHGYASLVGFRGEGGGSQMEYHYEYDSEGKPTRIHMFSNMMGEYNYVDVMSSEYAYEQWKQYNTVYSSENMPELNNNITSSYTVNDRGIFPDVKYVETLYGYELKNYSSKILKDKAYDSFNKIIRGYQHDTTTDDKGLISTISVFADNGDTMEYSCTYTFDEDNMPTGVTVSNGESTYELKFMVYKINCDLEYDNNGNPVRGTYTDQDGKVIATAKADFVVLDENITDNLKAYEAQNGIKLEEDSNEMF